ncbi:hypothetical protein GF367_00700 [Candidatus Woesearchaeota archaeon]|nr:hypothetical protein [Candidatus Woesearchaeota archaeon]
MPDIGEDPGEPGFPVPEPPPGLSGEDGGEGGAGGGAFGGGSNASVVDDQGEPVDDDRKGIAGLFGGRDDADEDESQEGVDGGGVADDVAVGVVPDVPVLTWLVGGLLAVVVIVVVGLLLWRRKRQELPDKI